MTAAIATMFTWAAVLLVIAILAVLAGIKFMLMARKQKHNAEDMVKLVERRTKMEYNKIATLPPQELHHYLTVIFSRQLILAADSDVSDKDPNALEMLYIAASAGLLEYLGPETVSAIEYYYGEQYLTRWMKDSYRALEYESLIGGIIKKERNEAKTIATRMMAWQ